MAKKPSTPEESPDKASGQEAEKETVSEGLIKVCPSTKVLEKSGPQAAFFDEESKATIRAPFTWSQKTIFVASLLDKGDLVLVA